MSDWTAGYVADIGYTYGYYGELNPARVQQAFLNNGLVAPQFGTACELGFGQGVSAVMHATASPTKWYGTDFNPAQAAFAAELAAVADSGAHLVDQSFAEFCSRDDLPGFDYIGLHGIWSWISDENRAIIVDFIRRKLKVGGVLYISYNCEAGWAQMVPMRRLLTEHAALMSAPGAGTVPRVDAALAFAEKLLETNPLFARANPQIRERIKSMKTQDRHYLAHEYFNRDWQPMSFTQMSEWLSDAKLEFACSAHPLEQIPGINYTAEQQALLSELPHAGLRETVRDFMTNQAFRRDYWVKGARKMSSLESLAAVNKQRFILLNRPADVDLKVKGALGEAAMDEKIYVPLLTAMADHQPKSVSELAQALMGHSINVAQLLQSLLVLVGRGAILAAQEEPVIEQMQGRCDKLNDYLLNKARNSGDVTFLASPVTGGGIPTDRIHQLFLYARSHGASSLAEMATVAWQSLRLEKRAIIKDGKTYSSEAEMKELLQAEAEKFVQNTLPRLIGLRIAR